LKDKKKVKTVKTSSGINHFLQTSLMAANSFLGKLVGNAVEGDRNLDLVKPILIETVEVIEMNYDLAFRDSLAFTNLRIIHVDRQGISGKKVRITSIPYKKISWFSVETAGTVDLDAELDIKVMGDGHPSKFKFGKKVDLNPITKVLSYQVLLNTAK